MAGFDGYYVISSTSRDPGVVEPPGESPSDTDAKEELTLSLERAGTRNYHWLGVTTRPTEDVDHPFGNDTTPLVGLPADAQRVRAVDATAEPEQRELSLMPTSTVTAELGDVDLYDATALPFDEPVYLYDLPYAQQGDVDAAVFDTYGESDRVNADGAFVWAQVFDSAHVFDGDAVVENGILRLTISEPEAVDGTGTLTAERWDASAAGGDGDWVAVGLPDPSTMDTEWRPLDLDVVATSPARVAAQLEFEAVAGDREGDIYAVDVALDRGREDALITLTGSATDPIPTDLETHLDPIASESIVDAFGDVRQSPQQLVAREEVRL
ncbi:hypothetical protein [Haloparvum sedimenti]|uniref:hypothetical protein n=1 Tax=Haloparvum sedimenti TaxID=1678448 RepID=UPI000F782AE5|nr:hypothetical protein [Haloparvum sedimenti]